MRRHNLFGILSAGIVLGLALQGCVTAPNVEVDKAAAVQTKRIALLAIPDPHEIDVADIGGGAGFFGIVGGLIQAKMNSDHGQQFADFLKKKNISLAQSLMSAIMDALKRDGYEVSVVSGQKPKRAADGKSDDYSDVHVDADAILSVWFGPDMGYVSPPNDGDYQPWVLIKVRLLDAKTKKDIYYKTIVVGWKMRIKESIYLEADEKYRYESFDLFVAKEDEAAAGLLDCERLVAKQVGSDLKVR